MDEKFSLRLKHGDCVRSEAKIEARCWEDTNHCRELTAGALVTQ